MYPHLSKCGGAECKASGTFEHSLSNVFWRPFLLAGAVAVDVAPRVFDPGWSEICKIMSNELTMHISCFYPLF